MRSGQEVGEIRETGRPGDQGDEEIRESIRRRVDRRSGESIEEWTRWNCKRNTDLKYLVIHLMRSTFDEECTPGEGEGNLKGEGNLTGNSSWEGGGEEQA